MPVYANGPFSPNVTTLERGKPGYSLGGFNDQQPQVKALVTNVALATNVATVSLTIIEGDAPASGSLIYIQGSTVASGAFNVSGVALTGSTFTGATGTVTFALTHADVGTAPDVGIGVVLTPEVPEGSVSAAVYVGKQFGLPQTSSGRSAGDTISWSYQFPGTAPATVTVALQGADVDVDAQYSTIDSGTSTTGETRPPFSVSGMTGVNFLRIAITVLSGGPITPVAKITA